MSSTTKINNFIKYMVNVKNNILNLPKIKLNYIGFARFDYINSLLFNYNFIPLEFYFSENRLEQKVGHIIRTNNNNNIDKTIPVNNKTLPIINKKKYDKGKYNLNNQKNLFRNSNYKKTVIRKKF
jgi:hypothetical protein